VRRCARRFVLLAAGGVLIRWACGAEKVIADEPAVDVEVLADHTADISHHHKHLHHKE
jgi:hypothetical protein